MDDRATPRPAAAGRRSEKNEQGSEPAGARARVHRNERRALDRALALRDEAARLLARAEEQAARLRDEAAAEVAELRRRASAEIERPRTGAADVEAGLGADEVQALVALVASVEAERDALAAELSAVRDDLDRRQRGDEGGAAPR